MAWLSLKIGADDKTADLLSDALLELGALSASIEDANAETTLEQPLFGEPGDPPPGIWQQNIVSALFDETFIASDIIQSLSDSTGLDNLSYSTEVIAEQDWVRATQSQFAPIRINDDLWIVPSWHDTPAPGAINIILDPGLAFGTGSHPTTHLCLSWLSKTVTNGQTVLDYGCGSGILAIAAKKLGAGRVMATDIDDQALQSSLYNAEQNATAIEIYAPDQLPSIEADIVVANILSSALTVLAPVLSRVCRPGGQIALSGILQDQAEQVTKVYAEWFDMAPSNFMDGWALLTGTKR